MPAEHPGALQELARPLTPDEVKARVYPLSQVADEALKEQLGSRVAHINEVGSYVVFSGGKRLRPVLFILACRALGAEAEPNLAAIFEYLHAATLLHDDVVDEAGLRRGREAARVRYGNDSVILVGDFLFSVSYSLAVTVPDVRFVAALAKCTTDMAEGQVLELIHTDDLDLDLAGYLDVIRAKTAVLLAASCQMGAIRAGADPALEQALYDYGLELGLAFQMVDDALDYVGTSHEFGKPVGHDLAEGKITLPFIHAREQASEEQRERLLRLAQEGRTSPEAVAEAKELVKALGGVKATYAAARERAMRAQAALAKLGQPQPGSELETLMALPAYVLERRN